MHVWKVTSNNKYYRNLWPELLGGNYVAIGWDAIRDFRQYENDEIRLLAALQREYNVENGTGSVAQIRSFRDQMQQGDVVVSTEGFRRVNGVGIIASDYIGEETADNPRLRSEFRNIREVVWKWARNDRATPPIRPVEIDVNPRFGFWTVTSLGVDIVRVDGRLETIGDDNYRARFQRILELTGLDLSDLVR